ncbi:helix-turn-helix domain-containing protein [Burkholderia ambifaria]|uniref:helix-turn-helix domain-containing protein n=1 Tax=Burkholderia ambifaria TaxID=152480 RepID=UPI003C7D2A05
MERDPPRRERSFARAAAQRGPSRSALSHAMLGLEVRLRVRLLCARRVASSARVTTYDSWARWPIGADA